MFSVAMRHIPKPTATMGADDDRKLPASASLKAPSQGSTNPEVERTGDEAANGEENIPPDLSAIVDALPETVTDPSDDDDNWSRQVETDDTTIAQDDSFPIRSSSNLSNTSTTPQTTTTAPSPSTSSDAVPPPRGPELSMKEKLVQREREQRRERERARLKRSFVQSNANSSPAHQQPFALSATAIPRSSSDRDSCGGEDDAEEHESVVAHPPGDDEEAPQEQTLLGFNMERFLRNSESFPTLEPTAEEGETMLERFLSEPVEVGSAEPTTTNRNVSFKSAVGDRTESGLVGVSGSAVASVDQQRTLSMIVNASTDGDDGDHEIQDTEEAAPGAPSSDGGEPRFLQLTEADMLEMASIDHASIGNAPPSEREDSEVGELVSHHNPGNPRGTFSIDTPTTAMESGSQLSGEAQQHLQQQTRSTSVVDIVSNGSSERDIRRPTDRLPETHTAVPAPVAENRRNNMEPPQSPVPLDDVMDRDLMGVSPLHSRGGRLMIPSIPDYGAGDSEDRLSMLPSVVGGGDDRRRESEPLLPITSNTDVPPEIITRRAQSDSMILNEQRTRFMRFPSIRSAFDSVFSEVRSEDPEAKEAIESESSKYAASGILARGRLLEQVIAVVMLSLRQLLFFSSSQPSLNVSSP